MLLAFSLGKFADEGADGSMRGFIGSIAAAMVFMTVATWAARAGAESNPRIVTRQLIEQLQTGKPREVELGPSVRKVIADQTNNTGVYRSLAGLGAVSGVLLNNTVPLKRGTLYALTATHDRGTSTWYVGIGADSQRVEYFEFKVARAATPLPNSRADPRPDPLPGATATRAPRSDLRPDPLPDPLPGAVSTPTPPRIPEASPRAAGAGGAADTSAACRKFPNLC